jgi:hypothetical protein
MVSRQPVISDLTHEFPQLAGSPAWSNSTGQDGQWLEFAHLVQDLHNQGNYRRVQTAFERLEELLSEDDPEVQAWVAGFLQTLQDVALWGPDGGHAIVRFLGVRTRHMWATLDAIRFDLAGCSILEAEVLMWRVVHHRRSSASPRNDT